MVAKNPNSTTKANGDKFTKGINIPPQQTIPKMPPVQPPKRSK
jgi:hypothetical protein